MAADEDRPGIHGYHHAPTVADRRGHAHVSGGCISDPQVEADPSWLNGPPYAVAEEVWDEESFGAFEGVAGIVWD
jgi:hypothetical protein